MTVINIYEESLSNHNVLENNAVSNGTIEIPISSQQTFPSSHRRQSETESEARTKAEQEVIASQSRSLAGEVIKLVHS
jgi:hypothetical protein